ncbi:helix-turn-helix protein [Anatilimnocola aggregata]|uniref:Helix-turn-helix protein n=1 Tax=Anatilimnocola aggregata TaxID=2528021 RepID=A0A517YC21_9BACT|nr:helix-turn-helix transcriptional regulator [Anatilimnocola aggregata]QDU27761.1 helix-turn-helix protein [Anatilimnocola aggregata]
MSLTDQLREAIRDCGTSVNALAKECGVAQPMLARFMNGQDLRLTTADKLAAHFGLELRPAEPKPPKRKKA